MKTFEDEMLYSEGLDAEALRIMSNPRADDIDIAEASVCAIRSLAAATRATAIASHGEPLTVMLEELKPEPGWDFIKLQLEGGFLNTVARRGGQTIQAGRDMEKMVEELVDVVKYWCFDKRS